MVKGTIFRIDDTISDELDMVCRIQGITRSECVSRLIHSAFDSYNDNQELKAMMEKLRELSAMVNKAPTP